jgi:5-methylcytosine-specific restriction endonuclease McrA
MEYSEKLKDERWLLLREEILKRDWYMCQMCMSSKNLQVHHMDYDGEPWESKTIDLITLCENCHELEHGLKEDQSFKGVKSVLSERYKKSVVDIRRL